MQPNARARSRTLFLNFYFGSYILVSQAKLLFQASPIWLLMQGGCLYITFQTGYLLQLLVSFLTCFIGQKGDF